MPFIYETFAQRKISAEANAMTEYVLGLRGIVPNYGSQFLLQSVGTVLKVGTGMLVFTGRKGINTELLEIDVVPEVLGTKTKYIIVTFDGTQQPTLASASITVSDTSEGSITSKTEDLMADVQGIVKFDLGTFINTTSGINSASLTITCPITEQEIIDNIKDDIFGLQGDLSDLRDDFDNLEIGARNILRGTSNPVLTTLTTEGTWENGKFVSAPGGNTISAIDVVDSPVPSVDKGIKFSKTALSGTMVVIQREVFLQKGKYTSSVWVNGTEGAVVGILGVRDFGVAAGNGQLFTLESGWNRLEVTQNVLTSRNKDIFRFALVSNVIGEEVTILAPQVERSNIASDWRPAPDDTPYTRSQLISSATYAVGATIPYDLSIWDEIQIEVAGGIICRLIQTESSKIFRGSMVYASSVLPGVHNSYFSEIKFESGNWVVAISEVMLHVIPTTNWHQGPNTRPITNIRGIFRKG